VEISREGRAQCCIAGGGPAGIMLGYLLARFGIEVVVLEKHRDFFRDFRGDTIHPSTLQVMDELGLLTDFLKLPHTEIRELGGRVAGESVRVADFSTVPGRCKFIALMPQWDFLNFLAERGRRFSTFDLRMEAEVTDLLIDADRVAGVRVKTPAGELQVRASLVVAADGRTSILRDRAGMAAIERGVPIDVLWLRLSKRPDDPPQTFGNVAAGGILVTLDRGDYFQCAFVIQKGGYNVMRERGIEYLRQRIAELAPYLADRVGEIRTWDDVKLLTVAVNHLPVWYRPGLLFIGDAAHAMSPIGGVGINLAIQDAVATANLLADDLRRGVPGVKRLAAVQRRREFPTKVIQGFQVLMHDRVLGRVLGAQRSFKLPFLFRIVDAVKPLRWLPAWFIGVGVRPEHVHTGVSSQAERSPRPSSHDSKTW
jgi:2-polyprenyl-6-methoxyphenol hydroxylase-like FAD-dependent oxidoreductase